MEKYRITIFDSLTPTMSETGVCVFRMESGATDTSDIHSWKMIGEYESLRWAFFHNTAFKPSEFRVVGDTFNPVVLQNF